VSACDYLPILLIDVDKVSLKTLVHLGRKASSTPFIRLVIQSKQYFEEHHLQTILFKKNIPRKVIWTLVPCPELINLLCIEYLCAVNKKLISFVFIESIDNEAFPEDIYLGVFECLAIGSSGQELEEIQS
jgi:hypothetical protein